MELVQNFRLGFNPFKALRNASTEMQLHKLCLPKMH